MNIPNQIQAGAHLTWTESSSEYLPSAGYSCHYILRNNTVSYTFAGLVNGDSFDFTLTTAVSVLMAEGSYDAVMYFESNGNRYAYEKCSITILPDPVTASTYDNRTHAEKTLALIEAAIERNAGKEFVNITISTDLGSRALQYRTMAELQKARNHYKSMVMREKKNIKKLKLKFTGN